MSPEERAERLRQRFLFPEAKDSFVAIVAAEIRAAVAAEREACARIADELATDVVGDDDAEARVRGVAEDLALAIRARAEGARP